MGHFKAIQTVDFSQAIDEMLILRCSGMEPHDSFLSICTGYKSFRDRRSALCVGSVLYSVAVRRSQLQWATFSSGVPSNISKISHHKSPRMQGVIPGSAVCMKSPIMKLC